MGTRNLFFKKSENDHGAVNQWSPSDPPSSPTSHANRRIRLGTKDEGEKDCSITSSNQHGPGILVGGVSYLVRERETWGINQHLRGGENEPGTVKNEHCRVYLFQSKPELCEQPSTSPQLNYPSGKH